MQTLETIYRFLDTIAAIVRNINPLPKKLSFIYFYIKIFFLRPIGKTEFEGKTVYFEKYNSLLAGISEIFFNLCYEFDSSNKNPVIYDCGANIGITAIYYKSRFPNSKIVLFEPVPTTFKLLKRNTKSLKNIFLHQVGIAETIKQINIYTPKNADSLNYSTNKLRWKENELVKIKIKTVKLSQIMNDTIVDCLILDIEGNEDKVLLDLDKTKKLKGIKNIFVEFHNYDNSSLSRILKVLTDNNFKIVVGSGVKPPYSKYKNSFWSLPIYAYQV